MALACLLPFIFSISEKPLSRSVRYGLVAIVIIGLAWAALASPAKQCNASSMNTNATIASTQYKRELARRPAQLVNWSVDLHGYFSAEASEIVKNYLRRAKREGNVAQIEFITGRGLHSKDGVPVLRPMVLQLCQDMGFNAYVGNNKGVVICDTC